MNLQLKHIATQRLQPITLLLWTDIKLQWPKGQLLIGGWPAVTNYINHHVTPTKYIIHYKKSKFFSCFVQRLPLHRSFTELGTEFHGVGCMFYWLALRANLFHAKALRKKDWAGMTSFRKMSSLAGVAPGALHQTISCEAQRMIFIFFPVSTLRLGS